MTPDPEDPPDDASDGESPDDDASTDRADDEHSSAVSTAADDEPSPTEADAHPGDADAESVEGDAESTTDDATAAGTESGGISYGAPPSDGASPPGDGAGGDGPGGTDDAGDDAGDGESGPDDEDASIDVDVIETLVIDPDDVLECMSHNGQLEDARLGKAVFGITPPFEATIEPEVRYIDDEYAEEVDEDGFHVRAFRLVNRGRQVLEQRPTRELARERLGDDVDEAELDEWVAAAIERWEGHVRDNLLEKVDVYTNHRMAIVDVRYED